MPVSTKTSTILWDLDGTLVDSQADIFDCLCRSVENAGLPVEKLRGELRIGPPVDVLVCQAFPGIDNLRLATVVAGFRKYYDYSDFPQTTPFSGIENLLHSIPSMSQFIITNKPQLPSASMIRKFKWEHVFKDIYTPDKMQPIRKFTKTELFSKVILEHRLAAQECLAIGDTAADIQAAHAAGVCAIAVSWGYTPYDELVKAKPDAIVRSVEELLAMLTHDPLHEAGGCGGQHR